MDIYNNLSPKELAQIIQICVYSWWITCKLCMHTEMNEEKKRKTCWKKSCKYEYDRLEMWATLFTQYQQQHSFLLDWTISSRQRSKQAVFPQAFRQGPPVSPTCSERDGIFAPILLPVHQASQSVSKRCPQPVSESAACYLHRWGSESGWGLNPNPGPDLILPMSITVIVWNIL